MDITVPHAENSDISVMEGEKEKVQELVCKRLRGTTDGPLFNNTEESSIKDLGCSTRNDKQTTNKAHCKIQQGAVFSGKILSFGCSVCKDNLTFSPNDLLKHFKAVHKGILPTYPCDLCEFVTNEFPVLQRHRIEHRNTLVTCELCHDDVQYSLLLLTRHYIMCHSVNGQFNCDWCEFSTLDAGTFVQHIHHHNESHWKCSKCRYISLTEDDHHKHMKAHSGTFPFTCQTCGYGAAKSEYLKKHTAAVHKEEVEKRNTWKSIEDVGKPTNPSGSLKFLQKQSGESQEAQRISKVTCLSGTLQNQNRLSEPEITFEESCTFIDGAKNKDNRSWKGSQNTRQSIPVMLQECENSLSSDAESHINANGLTVLMVKNRITLPPNCTTKVMGFKMVDGKKHLVLKVIPIGNVSSPSTNHTLVDINSCSVPSPVFEKSKASFQNGQFSDGKSSASISPSLSSCIQVGNDMAVKVKVEEGENSVCTLGCTQQKDVWEQVLPSRSYCGNILHPMTNRSDHKDAESQPNETCIELSKLSNETSHGRSHINNTTSVCTNKDPCSTKVAQKALVAKQVKKKVENSVLSENISATDGNDELSDSSDKLIIKPIGSAENVANVVVNSVENAQSFQEKNGRTPTQIKQKNGQQNVKDLVLPWQFSPQNSVDYRESAATQNFTQDLLRSGREESNQEVFSFHNYSKEAFSTSPNGTQELANNFKHSGNIKNITEASPFSLTLAESSEQFTEITADDIKVNDCIADVDKPLTEENPDSLLQDFNIIKIEEESIPISKNQSEIMMCSGNSTGNFEEHLEDISLQSPCNDSSKQTKTTLRIVQLPEGKQPLLLRASPGFKVITNSVNPQNNVTSMKPGLESHVRGISLNPKCKRIDVSAKSGTTKKGIALHSGVQPGGSTLSSHYLINSPGFKGPVIFSSTPNHTFTDKTSKTQPTCYFVQRSQIPFVQNSSTAGLSTACTQLSPLNSAVLGMPLSSSNKPSSLQSGCQTFLLRYVSPSKSGHLFHNPETKSASQCSQTSESSRNKVIFKIVASTGSFPPSGSSTSSNQPMFLTSRPQTQCFLVSSNKTSAVFPNRVKKLITVQNTEQTHLKESFVSSSLMNVKVQQCEAEKSILAPRPVRPPSQRKRRRKALFDELPPAVHKTRRHSSKVQTEKDTTVLWKPVAKEMERTLRLAPFSTVQQIKCPRKYQPVVVLNHPDADIPEVTNIMKVVNRYKGAVTKVSLSQKTIQALSELGALWKNSLTKSTSGHSNDPRPRPVHSSVRERFLLRLKLRRKGKKKYQIVEALSGCQQKPVVFDCWFCGRLFNNQEDWIGHGQKHLMEATRDWNKLF